MPYYKEHYLKNKERYATRRKAQRARNRAFIHSLKDSPCADCGQSYPYYVMDFDHRPGEVKLFNIGDAPNLGYGPKRVLPEVEKCDLVCANCHRERTHG